MTPRRRPKDTPLNRLIHQELSGSAPGEKMLFIDSENHIREAVYPKEFHTGELERVRERLETAGELKAVVHIAAIGLGHHGPRITYVDYLPDNWVYSIAWRPPLFSWDPTDEETQEEFKKFFGNGD